MQRDSSTVEAKQVPRRSPAWGRRLHVARASTQVLVLGYVAWEIGAHAVAGTVGATEALCPFGGFESGWAWLTGGHTLSHIHTANLVLAGALLAVALVARGFFCGWLCPLGTLQEWVHKGTSALTGRVPVLRRLRRRWRASLAASPRRARVLARADRVARFGRYLVLAWAVGGAAVTGVLVFRDVDPWEAVITVTEFEFGAGAVILLVTLLLSTVIERPWCRYACPLGAVQGLVAKLSPVRVERDAASCAGCDLCTRACPMGITVHQATRVTHSACLGCLECVAACPSRDALAVTVTLPVPRPSEPMVVPEGATIPSVVPQSATKEA